MSGELAQLDDQTILAQYGPMRLTIQAWRDEAPDTDLGARAGEFSFTLLTRLAPARELFLRERLAEAATPPDYDEPLLNRMAAAARAARHEGLGPMATVAGTVAEAVTLYLKEQGASKAIVENGGDLAIYLAPGHTASVGVRLGLARQAPDYKLTLRGDRRPLWGVCSSGMGGRSLTRGIADTAMAIAAETPVADAVATALGNECTVASKNIRRVAAETLRPDTDIRGLDVTEWVGDLTQAEVDAALDNAMRYAEGLVRDGVILGGLVSLRGETRLTKRFRELVAPLEKL